MSLELLNFAGVWRELLALFGFRAVPIAAWLAFSRSVPVPTRALGAVLCLGLGYLSGVDGVPRGIPAAIAYLYFGVLALCVHNMVPARPLRGLAAGLAVMLCGIAFLGVPGWFAPPSLQEVMLVLGWDLALRSYSYVVERSKSSESVSVADGLFFLLVNPVLVYSQRGRRVGPPSLEPRALLRCGAGLVATYGAILLTSPALQSTHARLAASNVGELGMTSALGGILFLSTYFKFSGLANIQIGLMRQLGYAIPERYAQPWRATTPMDFWRRWNTYVGGWVLRYVFNPIALGLTRRRPHQTRVWMALAIVVAFAVVGFLHIVPEWMVTGLPRWQGLYVFLLAGCSVLAWSGAASLVPGEARGRMMASIWARAVITNGSRVALWMFTLSLFGWWMKASLS